MADENTRWLKYIKVDNELYGVSYIAGDDLSIDRHSINYFHYSFKDLKNKLKKNNVEEFFPCDVIVDENRSWRILEIDNNNKYIDLMCNSSFNASLTGTYVNDIFIEKFGEQYSEDITEKDELGKYWLLSENEIFGEQIFSISPSGHKYSAFYYMDYEGASSTSNKYALRDYASSTTIVGFSYSSSGGLVTANGLTTLSSYGKYWITPCIRITGE
jgi:hypothetical protein